LVRREIKWLHLDSLTKSQEHSGKKIQIIDDCNLVVRAKISTVCMMLKKKSHRSGHVWRLPEPSLFSKIQCNNYFFYYRKSLRHHFTSDVFEMTYFWDWVETTVIINDSFCHRMGYCSHFQCLNKILNKVTINYIFIKNDYASLNKQSILRKYFFIFLNWKLNSWNSSTLQFVRII
jgi:hypothetical protein